MVSDKNQQEDGFEVEAEVEEAGIEEETDIEVEAELLDLLNTDSSLFIAKVIDEHFPFSVRKLIEADKEFLIKMLTFKELKFLLSKLGLGLNQNWQLVKDLLMLDRSEQWEFIFQNLVSVQFLLSKASELNKASNHAGVAISVKDLVSLEPSVLELILAKRHEVIYLMQGANASLPNLVNLNIDALRRLLKSTVQTACLINNLSISWADLKYFNLTKIEYFLEKSSQIKILLGRLGVSSRNLMSLEGKQLECLIENLLQIEILIHKRKLFTFEELIQLNEAGLNKLVTNMHQVESLIVQTDITAKDLIDLIKSGKEGPFLDVSFSKIKEFLKDIEKISFRQLVDMAKQLDKPEKLTGLLKNSAGWRAWAAREGVYDLELNTFTAEDLEVLFFRSDVQKLKNILDRLSLSGSAPAPRP